MAVVVGTFSAALLGVTDVISGPIRSTPVAVLKVLTTGLVRAMPLRSVTGPTATVYTVDGFRGTAGVSVTRQSPLLKVAITLTGWLPAIRVIRLAVSVL